MTRLDELTVVVPTRDRPDRLARCLAAIAALDPAPGAVVVVDSASTDAHAMATVVGGAAALVRCERPGASRARNAGALAAATPLVAFVDDDVRVAPDWAARIVAPFADPDVVLVTGSVRAGAAEGLERAVAVTDDVPGGRFDGSFVGNVGASANLAVRREALVSVGGFDVLLGAGGRFRAAEDLDLIDRVLRQTSVQPGSGWHASDAVVLHDQWRSRRELLRLEVDYGIGYGVRLSKVLRADRGRARRVVAYEVRRLLRDLVGDTRRRYRFGLLSRLTWASAVVSGTAVGLLVPVHDGHLSGRTPTSKRTDGT